MAEAEARTTAFGWLGKCVFMSQGGEEADDTHRKFETRTTIIRTKTANTTLPR